MTTSLQSQSEAKRISFVPMTTKVLQRKCDCGQHTIAGDECSSCSKKTRGRLQRSAINYEPVKNDKQAPSIVHEVLRSPGQPLDAATRSFFEPRFGHDFSHVRVHTDAGAAASAKAVDALAYTVGHHVVFDTGRHSLTTGAGKYLLAHELTHVVQQSGGPVKAGEAIRLGSASDSFEHEASSVADGFVATGSIKAPQIVPLRSRTLQRQTRGGARRPPDTRPRLGSCRPVQDDLRPTAPWAVLQRGYQARCSAAAGTVTGQIGSAVDDILNLRMPRAPHLPDARSTVDCACAHGSPRQAALAALPVLVAAGSLARELYLHFLGGSGTEMPIDVAGMIARLPSVREKIRASIAHGGRSGTTRLNQSDYHDREYQFAYGAIDCVQWQALPPANRSWRTDPATQIRLSMLDYYEFHPGRHGVSQCAHAACVESVARGEARNFWTRGEAVVTWRELRL
jgi:hypothetical protein